jgi:hypothetical protein
MAWLRAWSSCQIPLLVACSHMPLLVNGGGEQASAVRRMEESSMALLRPRPDEHGDACCRGSQSAPALCRRWDENQSQRARGIIPGSQDSELSRQCAATGFKRPLTPSWAPALRHAGHTDTCDAGHSSTCACACARVGPAWQRGATEEPEKRKENWAGPVVCSHGCRIFSTLLPEK